MKRKSPCIVCTQATLRSMESACLRAAAEEADDSEDDPSEYHFDRDRSGVFFAVDLECVLHKYRRWHECFPRIKPFYGEGFLSFATH